MAEKVGMFVLEGAGGPGDVHVAACALSLDEWETIAMLLLACEKTFDEEKRYSDRDVCRKVITQLGTCLQQQGVQTTKGTDGQTHFTVVKPTFPDGPVGHA